LFDFFIALFKFSPLRVLRVFTWMFLSSALEGVSLLLLLPLLTLTNIKINLPNFTGPLGYLENLISPYKNTLPLWSVLIIYMGLVGVLAFLSYSRSVESSKLRLSFCQAIQNQCHESLLNAKLNFHAENKLADYAQVLTAEVMRLSAAISQWVMLISALGLVCIYGVLALIVSWKMSLVIMACSCLVIVILMGVNKKIFKNGEKTHQGFQSLYSEVLDHLNGLKEAKSLGIESVFQKSFEKINQELVSYQQEFARNNALTSVIYQMAAAFSLSLIFAIAYWRLEESWVNLVLLLMLFVRMIPRVSQVHTLYHSVINLYPSYLAILKTQKEALSHREAIPVFVSPLEGETDQQALGLLGREGDKNLDLEFKNLGLSYQNKIILKNINIKFPPNSLSLIIGPSGGGKSTFCDVLSGLVYPTEGFIYLNQKLARPGDWVNFRSQVAYFSQSVFLISGSIRENLCLGNNIYSDQDLIHALKQAGAWNFIKNRPEGLSSKIGDRGVTLSGGQRQRLALARVFLRTPKLLILDEVCAHLDQDNSEWIVEVIKNLKTSTKILIIIVSHHPEKWLGLADQILKIDQGFLSPEKIKKPETLEKLGALESEIFV